jgi:hypothetical protein
MSQLFGGRLWVRSAVVVSVITICGLVAMSCTSSSSPTAPSESAAGSVTTTASGAAPGPDVKTPICHYQKDLGTWKVTMLSPESLAAHLAKHNDALPGGISALSDTQLDMNCKKVK